MPELKVLNTPFWMILWIQPHNAVKMVILKQASDGGEKKKTLCGLV